MRDASSEGPDKSKLSIAATIASDFLVSESITASAASPYLLCIAGIRKVRSCPTVASDFTLSACCTTHGQHRCKLT